MKRDQGGTFLSAIFVDYDNIYLSLKRKNEEAAKRFAKDAPVWLKAIETGALITPTNGPAGDERRRLVMNRCYGNPVPRRNTTDNSTDMNSFPFVRHHFLRSGFEIADCPPLTAQLKNSSDIRMVMDVRDYLTHATYFDEFVILSGDADFTPVLHRLRAHARQTVIFANDYTAAPYTAICDGEVRESDLIKLLLDGRLGDHATETAIAHDASLIANARRDIIADVVAAVRSASQPVPLEVLADHAVRTIGHDRTIGTAWAGAGNFRDLLGQLLPEGLRLSAEAPYVVIDTMRHRTALPPVVTSAALAEAGQARGERGVAPAGRVSSNAAAAAPISRAAMPQPSHAAASERNYRRTAITQQGLETRAPLQQTPPSSHVPSPAAARSAAAAPSQPMRYAAADAPSADGAMAYAVPALRVRAPEQVSAPMAAPYAPAEPPARPADTTMSIQQSIARIHEACQAPPLAPPEYRSLFEVMAQEINENGLIGAQTILNITQRALEHGIEVRRDDARFVLEVVSEADPWFEQGASANLFAGRFRNFVVARCRSQGLDLSADELDLIEAWFAGNGAAVAPRQPATPVVPQPAQAATRAVPSNNEDRATAWPIEETFQPGRPSARAEYSEATTEQPTDDFPRIVRTRLRG